MQLNNTEQMKEIANKGAGKILQSLLAAWVAMIFGTALLIAAFHPVELNVYSSNEVINFLHQTWEVADDMGPAVKISLILVFSLLFLALRKYIINDNRLIVYLINCFLAFASVILVLAFLPAEFSRGFGIGLTGSRFDKQMMPYYLGGALLGGLVFSFSYLRSLYGEKK